MQKKSSIDCKLFAINDLAGQKADCSTTSHSCSECRQRPACLRTAQLASFSLPRCLFFWAGSFDRGQGAFSPAIEPEFANSVAITTFPALFWPNSFFSELKKLQQSQYVSVACNIDMRKQLFLDLAARSPGSPHWKRTICC